LFHIPTFIANNNNNKNKMETQQNNIMAVVQVSDMGAIVMLLG
jgi:hypothetical protein